MHKRTLYASIHAFKEILSSDAFLSLTLEFKGSYELCVHAL